MKHKQLAGLIVRAVQTTNGADTEWTYRRTAELPNVHVLQEVPRLVGVADVFKGLRCVLTCALHRDTKYMAVQVVTSGHVGYREKKLLNIVERGYAATYQPPR